ncbi:MAG: hypothetical protein ACRC5H_02600, partial [Treponemataceae bacterium]
MKKIFIVGSFILIIFQMNAQASFSSLFTKNRELFVIKTQYFDLIFPEESRETALLLANVADE